MSVLHTLMPVYDAHENHDADLVCTPKRAVELALAAPAAPDALSRALLRLRGLPQATTVSDLFDAMGFQTLHESPAEVVVGASGRPWRPRGSKARRRHE